MMPLTMAERITIGMVITYPVFSISLDDTGECRTYDTMFLCHPLSSFYLLHLSKLSMLAPMFFFYKVVLVK